MAAASTGVWRGEEWMLKAARPLVRAAGTAYKAALGALAHARSVEARIEAELAEVLSEPADPAMARIFGVPRNQPLLRTRLLRAPQWEAVVGPTYNPRSDLRFLTVFYHRADGPSGQRAMIQALSDAYRRLPHDHVKLRIPGRIDATRAAEIHPHAQLQLYCVAGRLDSAFARRHMRSHPAGRGLRVVLERDVQWMDELLFLIREQEDLGPSIESLGDPEDSIRALPSELEQILHTPGGRLLNLYDGDQLVGHVSVVPEDYPEPMGQVQHIEHIAVRISHRQRGLGRYLQVLAAGHAESRYGSLLVGLIDPQNLAALACASTYGRSPVESHVVVPAAEV